MNSSTISIGCTMSHPTYATPQVWQHPLQKISAPILARFWLTSGYISPLPLLFLSLLPLFHLPFFPFVLPPFLSFLPFHLFCFHPSHDYKYTFLDQSSVTTHPFSFFLSKKKKKGFVALSEKEERKMEEGRSFHRLESRNLVSFPQHPHDSLQGLIALKVTSLWWIYRAGWS